MNAGGICVGQRLCRTYIQALCNVLQGAAREMIQKYLRYNPTLR